MGELIGTLYLGPRCYKPNCDGMLAKRHDDSQWCMKCGEIFWKSLPEFQ